MLCVRSRDVASALTCAGAFQLLRMLLWSTRNFSSTPSGSLCAAFAFAAFFASTFFSHSGIGPPDDIW